MNLHLLASPGAAPDVAYPWWLVVVVTVVGLAVFIGAGYLFTRAAAVKEADITGTILMVAVALGGVLGVATGSWVAGSVASADAATVRASWSEDAAAYLSEKYITPVSAGDALRLANDEDVTAIVRGRITRIHLVPVSGDSLVLATWKALDGYTEVPHRKGH